MRSAFNPTPLPCGIPGATGAPSGAIGSGITFAFTDGTQDTPLPSGCTTEQVTPLHPRRSCHYTCNGFTGTATAGRGRLRLTIECQGQQKTCTTLTAPPAKQCTINASGPKGTGTCTVEATTLRAQGTATCR